MARKKMLIAGGVAIVAIIAFVIVVVIVGGIWLMRPRNTTAALAHTAAGQPKGSATTKTIGAEGGSISSADGRITVTFPAHAVSNATNFSIQPLTNMAPNGVGDAYELGPSGSTFSPPAKLTFKFTDKDLEGTGLEAFAIAYQDSAGAWQTLTGREIDKQNRTYAVSTTHFSRFACTYMGAHLEPEMQTVRVGQTCYVELQGCPAHEDGTLDKIQRVFGGKPKEECSGVYKSADGKTYAWSIPLDWKVDYGTIESGKRRVLYTAPTTRPQSGVALVNLHTVGEAADGSMVDSGAIVALIQIDAGFKAHGSDRGVVYSGTVCDLEKHFQIQATMQGMITLDIEFDPANTNAGRDNFFLQGKFHYSTNQGALAMSGHGLYEIRMLGQEGDAEIICHEDSEAHGPRGIGSSGMGEAHIFLDVLKTPECESPSKSP